MAETHELGGSTVVVDRATPKASFSSAIFFLFKQGLTLSCGWKGIFFFFDLQLLSPVVQRISHLQYILRMF